MEHVTRVCRQEECVALEEEVEDRVANLVSLLQARKSRLIEAARQTREARVRSLRDQVARCASHLQATTALLTFCIEALKENDSAAFLQIGGMLSVRAATAAGSWGGAEGVQEIARLPLLDLTLDDKPLRRAIDQLTFVQLKRKLPYFFLSLSASFASLRRNYSIPPSRSSPISSLRKRKRKANLESLESRHY